MAWMPGVPTQNPKQMNWWALSKLHFDSIRRGPLQALRKNTLNFKISRIRVNKEGCELIEQSFWNIVKQGLPNTSKHCQLFLISSLAWQGYSQQTSGSIHENQQWNVKYEVKDGKGKYWTNTSYLPEKAWHKQACSILKATRRNNLNTEYILQQSVTRAIALQVPRRWSMHIDAISTRTRD